MVLLEVDVPVCSVEEYIRTEDCSLLLLAVLTPALQLAEFEDHGIKPARFFMCTCLDLL